MAERWRGVSNAVLYSVQFEQELDDAVVDRIARALVGEPLWDLTAQQQYDALAEALRSDARLTDLIPERHTEEAYRDFLRRLLAHLDQARPWPEPPFQRLSMSRWDSFADAKPLARIRLSPMKVQERLSRVLTKVEGTGRQALLLRLRSGGEVALVTPWWPGTADTVVLQRDGERSREQAIAEFINDTGFTTDEVVPADGEESLARRG